MTKTKKSVNYSKVTATLVKEVKEVIADADKHSYSASKVYAAHNTVFELSEKPQTCSSCLRNRTRALRDWLKGYDEYAKASNSETLGYVAQTEGTVRYPMAEGIPFDFLPNEGTIVKGKVTRADGSKIKPGTYVTADGLEIIVQPGGKANIKEVEEDLT